ncbi:PREDICTED: uncharacterized protein LOC104791938 [Camelina sativa]|uniref:Uncharacterized protein LOC104791938 n=1 Tax=Camelina sativa TaxID=90675 RepID=A0ABM1RTP8_CAMSA|nr:PREDICTED: uncharacterized protein LOC104791938 [Camelina sativa]
MMKKKKQSRSQSSTKKTLEPSSDSSPSPRLLSIIRSKLASGKDLKHMFRGMRSKPVPGLSSQSRIVRCPECHKLLQEPLDATSYQCGGCDSILHAKRLELEGNDNTNTIPNALLSSQNHSLSTEVESAEGGSRTPVRSIQREYNSRASPSVERGYHSETVNKHKTSDIHREWMRMADEFSVTGNSDAFASARSSPYNSRSSTSQWKQHEGRYEDPPRVPFYPASPSPSSAYEYGYSSPFHGSHVSASEQSYYHHQPNQFKQYGREGSFQESSVASPTRFPGETSNGKYYPRSSQAQRHELQYHNLYESSNSTTPIRSVYSESSYQAAAAPHRSTYSKHSVGISKSDTSSEKSSRRDKKRYVRERNPVVKHHILPSAGGAPFATCSYCLELLQLPQVSPQGKHKRYQVRCGSCSGILKFSLRGKTDAVLDSPSFLDSGMGFADETVTNHQDSASKGHEEIYPDGSYLRCLDDDYGDIICKSTDAVLLSRSQEAFEDKGIKEDIKNISSIFLDSKLEALQPHLKPLVNHRLGKQQPASSDTIAETSRNHLEQSQEAHSEKSSEMDNNIIERVNCNLEESEYENNEHIKPEEVVGEGSGESLEVPEYKNERMSETREQAERVAERPISHCKELLNKNEYVYETCVLSKDTRDTHEFEWEETQKNEECGDEHTWEENMGDKPWMHLGKSQYIGDSINDSSLRNSETFEDTSVKEDIEHISNIYPDAMSTTPQSSLKSLVNDNAQLCEAIVTISRIHEEQSKHKYENFKERQELEMNISDRIRCELEGSRDTTNETLELNKVGEDGSIVSLEKASGAGEEGLLSHQMESPNENLETSYGTLETVYLEGSGFVGERTWEEIMEDRAGLHLEEYESIPVCMHDYELETILEPDEDPDERSGSDSQSSFNENGGSEERVMLHDSQDAIIEHSQYECESSSERQELSNTVFDIVRSEYETNETLGQNKIVGDGSVVSVSHEEGPWLVDENKTEALKDGVMVKDGPSLHLEKCENESMKVEETLEWTSERAPTFRLHESELGAMLEIDDDADGRSQNSSRSSFSDHDLSKERQLFNVEEPQLVIDGRTEPLQVGEMAKDTVSLDLEEYENESMKVDETFEWTPGRTLTFRRHECEVGTKNEPDADDIFRLSLDGALEQERMILMAHDKQENPWNTFKKCDADEDLPAFSSRVSSEDYKSPSKMAELDSEGEEEISRDQLEHFQKETGKSRLTSEPYAHIHSITEPSEIVGLRHALYQTQNSPLRSPLTSPIHTPIGSPLHYLMASQIRSPITSTINSHIVSPLRSPIISSGSLSDVLFLSKNVDDKKTEKHSSTVS